MMSRMIDRLRAEEGLRDVDIGFAAAQGGGDTLKDFKQTLVVQMGTVYVEDQKLDREGLDKLRNLGGG